MKDEGVSVSQRVKEFIREHRMDDVRQLALQAGKYADIDVPFAIQQIDGWQRARIKLPSWAAHDDILYPPHLAIEQCSSEITARYKAQLYQRLAGKNTAHDSRGGTSATPTSMADLTGGMGVDFSFLAPLFGKAHYIERQPSLCETARHNFQILGISHAEVTEGDGLEVLSHLPHQQLVFIDPARRDTHGARTYAISDCTPDILPSLPLLLEKTDVLMVKLSPMLDWHQTAEELESSCPGALKEIHILATGNECKELLVVLAAQRSDRPVALYCVNDGTCFITDTQEERRQPPCPTLSQLEEISGASWLYEPHAAIMKAGCFNTLSQRFPVRALSANSHLFVADSHLPDFPGRQLHILRTSSTNKQQLRKALEGIDRANITVRNFPMSAEQLRKRLHMADGGNHWIFASTIGRREHVIFVCEI